MSLRELAKAHLERQRESPATHLSQRDTLRGVPTGQKASRPYFLWLSAVPRNSEPGTAIIEPGRTVPPGRCREGGTNRTVGTPGTSGTAGTEQPSLALLQSLADKRNETAKRHKITDRWCRCGGLAELALPLGGRREVWRCLECAPGWWCA